jgi:VWFA-related protein
LTPPSESKGLPPISYVICLDTLNSAFDGYVQVRHALERLFKGQEASDAHYALVTLGRQPRVIRNLTRDPTVILAALGETDFSGAIGQSETIRRAGEETQLSQMLHRYCGNCDCASGQDPESKTNAGACLSEWQAIEGWAGAQAEQRRRVTLDFLNNLRGLVDRLGEVPGKRTIIFVSDGFNIQPGRELYGLMAAYTHAQGVLVHNTVQDMEPDVQLVVRAAQMRDVSFYTLDSRGVYNVFAVEINEPAVRAPFPSTNRVTDSSLGTTLANVQLDRQTVAKDNQSALQELAEDTGGDFFQNNNDFVRGLRQALDDSEAYFLLAYTPTHLIADGKFHNIKVEVDQKNALVRAKKGYFAPAVGWGAQLASAHPAQEERTKPPVSALPGGVPDTAPSPGERGGSALSPTGSKAATRPANVEDSRYGQATGPSKEIQPAPVLMVNWPVARLIRVIPQLDGLKPVESQVLLPEILERVGKNVATFTQSVTNLASNEEITEEQLKPDGKVSKEFKEKFEYLVLAEAGSNGATLREYRTDTSGKPVKPIGLTKGFMVTSGDFSAALCFLPTLQAESSFRYLGEQNLDGRKTYVMVFAQRSRSAGPAGLVRNASGESSVAPPLQGIAWIDSTNYQIARLRTDVFPPPSDASVWRLISDIHYREVHFPQLDSALWVPERIVVTMSLTDRMWRDEHHYSGFRIFRVDSKANADPSH